MLRAALAVTVPLAAGFAAHQAAPGLLPAIGGLLASVVDIGGPYPARVRRVVSATVAGGAVGLVLGDLIHGRGWVSFAVLIAVAGAARLLTGNGRPSPGSRGRGRGSAWTRWPTGSAADG
jgi:uncharacterized membrane protein YccC